MVTRTEKHDAAPEEVRNHPLVKEWRESTWKHVPEVPENQCRQVEYDPSKPASRRIGYARVSTKDQNLDLQIDALTKAGCDIIFEENVSGSKSDRPELQKALDILKDGDVLVFYKLDRLSRSHQHLFKICNMLQEKNANLHCTSHNIDTSTAGGRLFFSIQAMWAEYERETIVERTMAGLEAARNCGKKLGPKRKTDPKAVKALVKSGIDKAEVRKQLKISKATLYRALAS
jgi:DNA invertase Pin-like site-specific DNA recombinase